MKFETYQEKIKQEISLLSHKEKVTLCLMCCNRLSSLYDIFYETVHWGDPSVLSEIRSLATNWLNGSKVVPLLQKSKIDQVIPDTDAFDSLYVTYALNASAAHAYLLELILKNNQELLGYVLQYCYDTLDYHIQELLDPKCIERIPEEQIENHPLMLNEVNWQFDALQKVKGNENLLTLVTETEQKKILGNA